MSSTRRCEMQLGAPERYVTFNCTYASRSSRKDLAARMIICEYTLSYDHLTSTYTIISVIVSLADTNNNNNNAITITMGR